MVYINSLVQGFDVSIANTLEILSIGIESQLQS